MSKPVSTGIYDVFVNVYRTVLFVLIGNPLSMFVINLFIPSQAAAFVGNSDYFGDGIAAFYTKCALKWPFRWAKWWMKAENISAYTVEQQVKYFFKVSFKNKTEVETLKAMPQKGLFWPDAYETLFFKYGKEWLPITESRQAPGVFYESGEHLYQCSYMRSTLVMEFMMMFCRLSYNAFAEVVKSAQKSQSGIVIGDMQIALKNYLRRGAVSSTQVKLLAEAVPDGGGCNLQMLGIMTDYIKRYGVEKEIVQFLKSELPQNCFELVAEADKIYRHCRAVRAGQKDAAKWKEYCEQVPKLAKEAQKLMSFEQYLVYSDSGHTLDISAVWAFLKNGSEDFWKEIFAREPQHGVCNDVMERYIANHKDVSRIFRKVTGIKLTPKTVYGVEN